ncbi:putative RNA polymerase II subunit B1 CTD phosphatase RPAP2 isoform X1 [Carex littledalei]|uniref:RNA polymerase II subunit B1 CTD phosphatase RPAP2 homolog n=1 Tax=Carex littledalei TaxID=544730 RepID=A0A833RGC5_9POAL|nr:putative RNA polymerase II subunit B1 CTD phosphatase RPAP2 isoform X1 [Carex littledalei]
MAAQPPSFTTVAGAVYRLQMILLDHGAPSERHLLAAASLLSRSDYSDVVTERTIASLCGFPLCPNPLPPPSSDNRRGRYRISLPEHRVYDLDELGKFCSERCLIGSRAYEASLSEERSSDVSTAKMGAEEVFKLFEERDLNGTSPLPLPLQLTIKETTADDLNSNLKGVVAVEDWIGPSDAIEGYVPKSKSQSYQDSGLKPTTPEEMDFQSEIIFGDEMHDFSSFKTQDISDQISNKLESIVLGENNSKKKRNKGNKSLSKLPEPKAEKKLTSSAQRNCKSASGEEHSQQNGLKLKSSLKKEGSSSGPRTQNQSVRWADEERSYAKESSEKSDVLPEEDAAVRSLRFASAEACAEALSHAADIAASSGNSKVEDAVSEAGIVILPQSSYGTEEEHQENREGDMQEIGREVVKWPQKPVLLETDEFEVDDSWHDTPPEGFNLDLSPFCTIWMALFAWVTRSTLCYIYGHDESSSEEFSEVEGREYPQRVVLKDGQSAEIRKALDGFVCRTLPSLVSDLRLPVPVSTLEKYLGRLMDTMTFSEALPALRTRQWHVVVLLFLDALSVHHLPSLSSVMANRSLLIHKVLNGAQIEAAQYDSMIDIFLPLGRATSLSSIDRS